MKLVVDASAWVANLRQEPDVRSLLATIANAATVHLSAATYVEVGAVVDAARDGVASRRFGELLELLEVVIEPVTPGQARRAREAYRDFGRGSGHPAPLNQWDVLSYALATEVRVPLLFKGAEFTHTGVIDARLNGATPPAGPPLRGWPMAPFATGPSSPAVGQGSANPDDRPRTTTAGGWRLGRG